jgi:hypothetical protein
MRIVASSSPPSYQEENALRKEQEIFGELFYRLRDALINRIFDLRPSAASARLQYLLFLFFLSGFLVSLIYYPLNEWAGRVQNIFLYLFNPAFAANYPGNPIADFLNFLIRVFIDPRIIQYLPIFMAPFFIALQTAANYLADIFELEDVAVARQFVSAVALLGSNETIRITQGDIYDEHRTSPTYLIGGPGKVIVDIDSVALFEEPDGTTRVIGPTGKEPGGRARLDGFERFRQAIDLRDHFIVLREDDGKAAVVKSRSLDGIPITATDVRFMFSVHRDGQKPTLDNPYPFSKRAVERLIYKATSRVTPDLTNPSTFEFSWVNNMVGLIRGRLSRFMNEHKLAEYLASIGAPEVERVKKHEDEIAEELRSLVPSAEDEPSNGQEIKPAPKFTPRYKIKNLFSEFAEEFSKSQYERGVELHWIGVGTWKTPIEKISEKHMEAWAISRENLEKGSNAIMKRLRVEATVQKLMSLIQDVPLAQYQSVVSKYDHNDAVRALLGAYRQQLIEAAEFLKAKGEPAPSVIITAIQNINDILGYKGWHWVGTVRQDNGAPDAEEAAKQEEARLEEAAYQELTQLLGPDRVHADRLIEMERSRYPLESRRQLIERVIQRLQRGRQ